MTKPDPCERLTYNGQSDRFFPIGNIGNGQEGVLQCKLNRNKQTYQSYAIIEKDSFDRFNSNEENSLNVITFNSELDKTLKIKGKNKSEKQ